MKGSLLNAVEKVRYGARCGIGSFILTLGLLLVSAQTGSAASGSVTVRPLLFEPAESSNSPARFLARGPNYQFFISPTETSIVLRKVKSSATAISLYDSRASRQLF